MMVKHLMIIAVMTATWAVGQARAGDDWYSTTDGKQKIRRHPTLVVAGLDSRLNVEDIVSRVQKKIDKSQLQARLTFKGGPKGLKEQGVFLFEVDHSSFAAMDGVFSLLKADSNVTWAEPVYTIYGVELLYPSHLIAVRLAKDVSGKREARMHKKMDGKVVTFSPAVESTKMEWIEPIGDVGSVELANRYSELPGVMFAEPNFFVYRVPYYTPDDTYFEDQWHLHGRGTGVADDASIQAEAAWDLAYGLSSASPSGSLPAYNNTVVGICDTGVYTAHEDLLVIGDGWDTTGSGNIDPDPGESDEHGTCVSGVAAAVGDNGKGVVGACPTCGVVGIKLSLPGAISYQQIYQAYEWAGQSTDFNMAAINNSWGTESPATYVPMNATMKLAVDSFSVNARGGKGGVVVFAAGNSDQLSAFDGTMQYYRVLTVGASTIAGRRASYSSYGHCVAVLAPSSGGGGGITTTYVPSSGGAYTNDFGGTSSAAPVVTGIIGLMAEANPEINEAQIREAVIKSADHIDEGVADYQDSPFFEDEDVMFSFVYAHGRVNAERAVEIAMAYEDECTLEYELCNAIDDDCDGETDENGVCDLCKIDPQTNGREVCDDGKDNDCDGLTDPEDCVVPCEDLSGMCGPCTTSLDCWYGLECSTITMPPGGNNFCLRSCYPSGVCPDGYTCVTNWSLYLCTPADNSCAGDEPEWPNPTCEPEEDAGPDSDVDTDTDTDTSTDTDIDTDSDGDTDTETDTETDTGDEDDGSGSDSSCGCSQVGGFGKISLIDLVVL
jgi:hypothetical protein